MKGNKKPEELGVCSRFYKLGVLSNTNLLSHNSEARNQGVCRVGSF
jgi:hypothetical protein